MFVAMPVYDKMHPMTGLTLAAILARRSGAIGLEHRCPWVDIARSELVGLFLESTEESLLWIDADVYFDASLVDTMVAADTGVISVAYRRRNPPHTYCVTALGGAAPSKVPTRMVGSSRVIEIEQSGLGCCLVRRHVIEAMIAKQPELYYVNESGHKRHWLFQPFLFVDGGGTQRHAHDDTAFFLRVKAAGFKPECLVDAPITHDGHAGNLAELFSPPSSTPA